MVKVFRGDIWLVALAPAVGSKITITGSHPAPYLRYGICCAACFIRRISTVRASSSRR